MMSSFQDAVTIWTDVQNLAKSYREDPSISAWLERLRPYSIENGTFTALTQFRWTEQNVMTNYKSLIEGWIKQITLMDLDFRVVVDASLFSTADPQTLAAGEPQDQRRETPEAAPATSPTPAAQASVRPAATPAVLAPAPVTPEPMPATGPRPAAWPTVAPAAQPLTPPAPEVPAIGPVVPGCSPTEAQAGKTGEIDIIPEGVPAPVMVQTPVTPTETSAAQSVRNEVPAGAPSQEAPRIATAVETSEGAGVQAGTPTAAPAAARVGAGATSKAAGSSTKLAIEDFTFDTFVVGEANRMAYDVAREVAEGDRVPPNPIFFYSKSGLGKTHLLFAIMNYIHMYRNSEVKVVYASSNNFTEDYIEDIINRKRRGKEVMKKYRDTDILLIDDVQFLVNKQETMTTFFDIFNQLIYQGKTIVLTADEPPDYLQLDERMKTRFSSGTVLSIAQPSLELKLSILKSYYERKRAQISWFHANNRELGDRELTWIAQYSPNSIREMLGFLNTVMLKESTKPNIELTEDRIRAIHDEMYREEHKVELSTIVKVVAKEYGVSEQDMRGKRRTKQVSEARQVSMWLARQMTDGTYSSIGSFFDRDHTTALSSITKIEHMSQSDRTFMYKLEHLQKAIKNR